MTVFNRNKRFCSIFDNLICGFRHPRSALATQLWRTSREFEKIRGAWGRGYVTPSSLYSWFQLRQKLTQLCHARLLFEAKSAWESGNAVIVSVNIRVTRKLCSNAADINCTHKVTCTSYYTSDNPVQCLKARCIYSLLSCARLRNVFYIATYCKILYVSKWMK